MNEYDYDPARKRYLEVLGRRMACIDVGQGDPIVFQHGNPTSSYLWRGIIPHALPFGRCIALDLIGMGDSEKLPDSGPGRYTFAEHSRYFEAALETLGVRSRVILVIHDWGSALGFDWAERHRDAIRGIAHMESIAAPWTWETWPEQYRAGFRALRSPAGDDMVLRDNVFVEKILPHSILRPLAAQDLAEYRRPFLNPGEDRRPTLTWPRQIPISGEPADVVATVERYGRWLAQSRVPKLFVNAEPGGIIVGAHRELCRSWPNTTEITVPGIHFVQEDSPQEIGTALARWLATLP